MKPFTKRLALVMGLLFTALICMGIVYIDTVQNYWYVNGGFVKLIVSNQTQQAIMTVDTNTLFVGFNTNNNARSFIVQGRNPSNSVTGNGATANVTGSLGFFAGGGGDADTNGLAATGGAGGAVAFIGGTGGSALSTTSNSTGGTGGSMSLTGGTGGGERAVATNAITGGAGATVNLTGGSGGVPVFAATQTVAGAGGPVNVTGSDGTVPTAGWSRRPSAGGAALLRGGSGGNNAVRTNGANGANASLIAGNAGGVATAPGVAGQAGNAIITAGNGALGDTNSNGGSVYVRGGDPGSTATPGKIYLARSAAGSARGGVVVGLGEATLTNVLSFTASLDFPSIAAGTVADLQIAAAGAADGDVVTLSVPLSSVTNCTWMAFASNAVVWVRAANGQLGTAQDPNAGTFRVVVSKFQ